MQPLPIKPTHTPTATRRTDTKQLNTARSSAETNSPNDSKPPNRQTEATPGTNTSHRLSAHRNTIRHPLSFTHTNETACVTTSPTNTIGTSTSSYTFERHHLMTCENRRRTSTRQFRDQHHNQRHRQQTSRTDFNDPEHRHARNPPRLTMNPNNRQRTTP